MIKARPFQGLRPSLDSIEQLISPPYDVVDQRDVQRFLQGNPLSFLRVIRSDLESPNQQNSLNGEEVYFRARKNLKKLIDDKALLLEKEPCFYIYRMQKDSYCQTGLTALFSAQDYLEKRIKKHELTRPDKEKDRYSHIYYTRAYCGLVALLYRQKQAFDLSNFLNQYASQNQPLYDLHTEDRVRHLFYRIRAQDYSAQIEEYLSGLSCLYIADGHHRAASASSLFQNSLEKIEDSRNKGVSFFPAVIFPETEIQILSYNRAIKDLNGYSHSDFLQKIQEGGIEIQKGLYEKEAQDTVGMYLGSRQWYTLRFANMKEQLKHTEALGVSMLQERLLSPLLGIDDPRMSTRISFAGGSLGTQELERLVDQEGYSVSFQLPSVQTEILLDTADRDQIMPPKSTWFEPKLRSGFVTHLISPDEYSPSFVD